MALVGSFGAARAAGNAPAFDPDKLDKFEFLGTEFRVAPNPGGAARMIDLAEAAISSGADTESLAGVAILKESARQLVYKDDWAKFWALYSEQEGTAEELAELTMALAKYVTERAAARPTERPSDSSPGSSATGSDSSGSSYPVPSVPPSSTVSISTEQFEAMQRAASGSTGYPSA